jgi:hypothetical protein
LIVPEATYFLDLVCIRDVLNRDGVEVTRLDQCRFGSRWRKPTVVVSSLPLSQLERRCSCTSAHRDTKGKDATGVSEANMAGPAVEELYEKIVSVAMEEITWVRRNVLEDEPVKPLRETLEEEMLIAHPKSAKGPVVARKWTRPERWKKVAVVRWQREEHVNVGEARALLLAVRHSSRSSEIRGRRVLILSDSLVVVGSISKGRSSSYPINRQCRRACAHAVLWGTRFLVRYVSTHRNPADGPSRGGRVGVKKSPLLRKQRGTFGAGPASRT